MSYKTDFDNKVASNLIDNSTGLITPAKVREVLSDSILSDKIAWKDTMQSPVLSFKYTRIADNTTPSSGEFSYNTAKNNLVMHSEDASGNDLSILFSSYKTGYINVNINGGAPFSILRVTNRTYSGNLFEFKGLKMIDELGSNMGLCTVDFNMTVEASSTQNIRKGTQMIMRADQVSQTTPQSSYFSFNDLTVDAANRLYLTFKNLQYKYTWDALMNQVSGSKTRIIFTPLYNPDDFFVVAVNGATTYNALTAEIILDDTKSININNDYTMYSDYVIELFTIA